MEYKTLGEICDVVSGGTPSRSKQEYWNGDIPWIKIGNIKSKYVSEADEFITEAGLSGSSAKMLKKGTILYTIFATLGEAGVLTIDACTNQAIAGISIKDESVIDRDYLFYYLKSKKNYVNEVGRGVAQNNINMSILRGFEVPIRKLYDLDGKILLIGVDYDKNTSIHLADVRAEYRGKHTCVEHSAVMENGKRVWKAYETLFVDGEDFKDIGIAFEAVHTVNTAAIGETELKIMKQRELVDFAVEWIEKHRQ